MVKTLVLLGCLQQQLDLAPYPAEAGRSVVITATHANAPLAGLPIECERPDGHREGVGSTDAAGRLEVAVTSAGMHVFRAQHGGVRLVAPLAVSAARPRWLYAAACVPLGLALLWRHLREARRQRAAAAPISCTGSGSSGSR